MLLARRASFASLILALLALSGCGGKVYIGDSPGAGGAGGGVGAPCGDASCGPGEYCCNASCGICAAEGEGCLAIACD